MLKLRWINKDIFTEFELLFATQISHLMSLKGMASFDVWLCSIHTFYLPYSHDIGMLKVAQKVRKAKHRNGA